MYRGEIIGFLSIHFIDKAFSQGRDIVLVSFNVYFRGWVLSFVVLKN